MREQFKTGALAALTHFGVKTARGNATAIPSWHQDLMFAQHGAPSPASSAPPPVSWDNFHQGAAQHVTTGAPLGGGLGAPASAAQQLHAPAPPPMRAPTPTPAAGAGASRFKMPGTLGMAGLAALGAGAWGLHHQHQQDQASNRLTYAPMQGGM